MEHLTDSAKLQLADNFCELTLVEPHRQVSAVTDKPTQRAASRQMCGDPV